MKKILQKIFIFLLVMMPFTPVLAGNLKDAFSSGGPLDDFASNAGIPTENRTVEPIINNALQVIFSFLGVIFLLLAFYAGFQWMTAQGNGKKVEDSKHLLTAAVIGLIIVIAAYAITLLVMTKFASNLLSE